MCGTGTFGRWPVEDLDALVRGAGIGIALVLGAMVWRAQVRRAFAWVGLLWCTGIVGYLLWGHAATTSWPLLVRFALVPLTLMSPFFFWAIVRMVFDDEFELRATHWLILALIVVAGLAQFLLFRTAPEWLLSLISYGHRLPSLVLVAHAFWVVWRGRSTDLVEPRARLRVPMLRTGGATALLVLA